MSEIPQEVRDLIRGRVTSMDHVEVLMRLHEAEGAALTPNQIERSARLGPQTVQRCLTELVTGSLASHDAASNSYRYAPSNASDRSAVDSLSTAYHQRPVSLVKIVYEQPPPPVKSFADAFRLRDDPPEKK